MWTSASGRNAEAPVVVGKDLDGKDYQVRLGLLHLLEARAQMANMYHLIETSPDDSKALGPRLSLIFGEPEAHAYALMFALASDMWRPWVEEPNNGMANVWLIMHPLWLLGFASAVHIPGDEVEWGSKISTFNGDFSDEGSFAWAMEYEHPLRLYFRLAQQAAANWFIGDWDVFEEVLEWANDICHAVCGSKLTDMIRKLVSGLDVALQKSNLEDKKLAHLIEGKRYLETVLDDPQVIVSPQRAAKGSRFEECVPPCGWYDGRFHYRGKASTAYAIEKIVLERILWGGRHHCGSSQASDCQGSSWCFFNDLGITGREYEACQEWFGNMLGNVLKIAR